MNKVLHFKGINGLRAIAALAVVISHITLDLDKYGLKSGIFGSDLNGKPKGLLLASYGVSIFFALSGFLITYLLLREKELFQKVKISHFYIRRALRIWPLYYFYIFLCFVTYYFYNISYNHSVVPFYLFMMANIPMIMGKLLPFLGHFWSLGVEEQFYLFWPWFAKLENKKLLKLSITLVIILFGLKIVFWKFGFSIPELIISVTRFHTMIIGCIGAIIYFSDLKNNFSNKYLQFISWLVLILIALNKFPVPSLIANEIVSVITVFIIFAQIERKNYIVDLDNKLIIPISFSIKRVRIRYTPTTIKSATKKVFAFNLID